MCPYCKESNYINQSASDQNAMICHRCQSPLQFVNFDPSWLSRRANNRIDRIMNINVSINRSTETSFLGTVDNLSPTGLRFKSYEPLKMGSIIRIESDELTAVASVMRCEIPSGENEHFSGVKFLTLKLKKAKGNFVSYKA